jgi:hypothetical protein
VYPLANVRLISGVEALVGLQMIGWSASFTDLAMEKFWLHGPATWLIKRAHREHARAGAFNGKETAAAASLRGL